jgi:hypothetical protein
LNKRLSYFALLIILIIFFIIIYYHYDLTLYEFLSVVFFIAIFLKFVSDLGSKLSVKNIIALLAILQWLIGPVLGYAFDPIIPDSYRMVVDRQTYFSYVFPATLFHILALYVPLSKTRLVLNSENYKNVSTYKTGIYLIIIGFIFEYMPGLGFFGYIISSFKYVGAYYVAFSDNRKKYLWIAFVFGYLFFSRSIVSGMFHELLLWGSFLVMVYYLVAPTSFLKRLNTVLAGFLVIFVIQLVKPEFRSRIAEERIEGQTDIEVFYDIFIEKTFGVDPPLFAQDNIASNIVRINQGWIISNVLANIPDHRPYANGESVKESIIATIYPRFVMPDKAKAGGRNNMERYAGITLNEATSMDISQVAEGYANYGVFGGIIFMIVLGLFFNVVITFIEKKSQKYPELIFWLPLLFLQVVKAETSLVTILNHLVKSGIVVWVIFSFPKWLQLNMRRGTFIITRGRF